MVKSLVVTYPVMQDMMSMASIVCAAVSALTATAMLGLTQIAQQEGEYTNSEGRCDIVLSGTINQSGQDILGTMLLGLEEISRQYPEFVQIHEI